MKAKYTHSFFCGHISISAETIAILQRQTLWGDVMLSEREYLQYCNIFYEGFVDSMLPVEDRKANSVYGKLSHMELSLNKSFSLDLNPSGDRRIEFMLKNIHLFILPFNVTLFAIEIESDEVELNDLTLAHFKLRNVMQYHCDKQIQDSGYLTLIKPLTNLCSKDINGEVNFSDLGHTGNKLKIYQIINCEDISDNTLYEVGTLSPIGSVADHTNINSPSDEYFKNAIETYRISVFRNWKVLNLFDTTTILRMGDRPAEGVFDQWSSSYFRLVYLHCLYQKTLLFGINQQFRAASVNRKRIGDLVQLMKEQESYYAFSKISYNFLPQMMYDGILQGFDVEGERQQLKYYLDQEMEKQRESSNDMLNIILTFIALLSVFSAIYDTSSLIKETFELDAATLSYRYIVFSCGGVVLLSFLLFMLYKFMRKLWDK
ncbi:MAG: hypothetical protein SNH35_01320 [Rikenellaceae bacterium]